MAQSSPQIYLLQISFLFERDSVSRVSRLAVYCHITLSGLLRDKMRCSHINFILNVNEAKQF